MNYDKHRARFAAQRSKQVIQAQLSKTPWTSYPTPMVQTDEEAEALMATLTITLPKPNIVLTFNTPP